MKLAILGTDGLPARYGGFETFAMEVSPHLVRMGHEVRVVGSSVGRPPHEQGPSGVQIRNLPLKANGVSSIPFDLVSLASVCRWADAVLLLGVSAGPFVPVMRRLVRGGNLIVNVDGLESRRAKWSATGKRYLVLAERMAIRGARHVVSDNMGLTELIARDHGLSAFTIAYGNDHVRMVDAAQRRSLLAEYGLEPDGYLLTVARIEPENNIDMMLDAIPRDIATPHVIVGNFTASSYGQHLLARYRDCRHVRLLSAIYDPMKLAALRSGCHAYLHGHSVGGTNPSLVEILPYGVPVLCFDCSFNRHTMGGHGGYFVTSSDLCQMLMSGDLGQYRPPTEIRDDSRYKWAAIAEDYARLAFEP